MKIYCLKISYESPFFVYICVYIYIKYKYNIQYILSVFVNSHQLAGCPVKYSTIQQCFNVYYESSN